MNKLYRYEYNTQCENLLDDIRPMLWEFEIIRHTPKGCFIQVGQKTKFVLNSAKNRYAYETVDLAKEAFIRRKRNEIAILKNRIKVAEAYLFVI